MGEVVRLADYRPTAPILFRDCPPDEKRRRWAVLMELTAAIQAEVELTRLAKQAGWQIVFEDGAGPNGGGSRVVRVRRTKQRMVA